MVTCPDCGTEMNNPEDTHACTPAARHSQAPARIVTNETMMDKAARQRLRS